MYSIDGELASERGALMALDPDALYGEAYPNKKRIVMPRRGSLPLISSPTYSQGPSDSALMRALASTASSVATQYAPPYVRAGLNALNMLSRVVSARKVAGALRRRIRAPTRTKTKPIVDVNMLPFKRSRKWKSASTGFYKGTFRRPRRTKEPKVETKCLKYGYHLTNEIHGDVEDHHCAYIGHNTYHPDLYGQAIAGALLRKLLKKAGVQMDNADQKLPLTFFQNATGHRIEFITYNQLTGFPTVHTTYDLVAAETFTTLLLSNFAGFKDYISSFLENVQQDEPYQLNFYANDAGVGYTDFRLQASLQLTNEFITLYASSALKIQNRTAGDTAVS